MHLLTHESNHDCYVSLNFAGGFFGIPDFLTDYRQLLIIENFNDFQNNNTLAPACANQDGAAGALGSAATTAWANVYLQDAVTRLNGMLDNSTGSDFEFTVADALGMQFGCAYEVSCMHLYARESAEKHDRRMR